MDSSPIRLLVSWRGWALETADFRFLERLAIVGAADLTEGDSANSASRQRERIAALELKLQQAQKMEAVGRLAAGIVHDFANLLTPIMAYSELVAASLPSDSNFQARLRVIRKAAERATELAQAILAFSRREATEPRVIDLNQLILETDWLLRLLLTADIQLVSLAAPHLGLVKIDPHRIEQVLINMATNARDAMPSGGKLIISSSNVSARDTEARLVQHVMLTITDEGVGMTEELKSRIFEPFFTTKEAGKGTGLGLSICRDIVTEAGGRITVESQPGEGTTFRIYLPGVEAEAV